MNKREKLLWFILILIVLIIMFIVFMIIEYKDNENNLSKVGDFLIEKKDWYCYNALYYPLDGTENLLDTNGLNLKFYDEYVEKCGVNNCKKYNYSINDDVLFLDGEYLDEEYKLIYEDDILIMEEKRDNGTRIVYYFNYSGVKG